MGVTMAWIPRTSVQQNPKPPVAEDGHTREKGGGEGSGVRATGSGRLEPDATCGVAAAATQEEIRWTTLESKLSAGGSTERSDWRCAIRIHVTCVLYITVAERRPTLGIASCTYVCVCVCVG
uniref:Uncharacterized protein n=1 Tax=Lotharella oceanica TaxID=641309 RepID=A0A7S2U3Z5_9EUKA